MNSTKCINALTKDLGGNGPTKNTAAIIHRLGHLLLDNETVEDPENIGTELHTMTRIFGLDRALTENFYKRLWAAPGMSQVLLNEPLLSRKWRLKAKNPNASLLKRWSTNETSADVGAANFAFLVFNLLMCKEKHEIQNNIMQQKLTISFRLRHREPHAHAQFL